MSNLTTHSNDHKLPVDEIKDIIQKVALYDCMHEFIIADYFMVYEWSDARPLHDRILVCVHLNRTLLDINQELIALYNHKESKVIIKSHFDVPLNEKNDVIINDLPIQMRPGLRRWLDEAPSPKVFFDGHEILTCSIQKYLDFVILWKIGLI